MPDKPPVHTFEESTLRRNYLLSVVEGGFFMGGMAFLSMESVMPAMVHDLGGPAWAVSLAPVLFIIGFSWPQIFSALWVERLQRMKPFIVTLGIIQRVPYIVTGLLLILVGEDYPGMAVTLAFLTPFVMASFGGIIGSAYFELMIRIIPLKRVASMWALRNILMAGFGIGAGFVIKSVLDAYPGPTGYGILHLIVFAMMSVSIILFAMLRETNIPEHLKLDPVTFRSGFAAFGKQWRDNPSLGRFVVTRILFMLVFVAIPFLSLRAIEQTGESASLVGLLVMTQMAGFILGNVFSGILGDRFGVRIPMLLGRLVLLCSLAGVILAIAPGHFMAVFFLLGFGLSTGHVGDMTMVLDFAPSYRRKFFFAVMGVLVVPGVLVASLISAVLQYLPHGFHIACISSAVAMALSLVFLYRVRDPRQG